MNWKKLFKLPSPKELGWAKENALPSRSFTPNCIGFTWEDWEEKMKSDYPIKYFIVKSLPNFIKYNIWFPVYRPINNSWYYLKCHVLTKHKYHLVDIRQRKSEIDSVDDYRYGWIDIDHRILLALFSLLDKFVEDELINYYCPTEEDIKENPSYAQQRDTYNEILALYRWWTVTRKWDSKNISDLGSKWVKSKSEDDYEKYSNAKKEFDEKEDEMIGRLLKIRRSLWT
jgi:hypothetical protein